MSAKEENAKYLKEKVDPILRSLVRDLLVNKPGQVVLFSPNPS
jgi:hypothetical protein